MVVDDARVECDAGPINFKPTVMFQTRLFNFSLKNTGLGSVDYKWAVQTLGGATDTSGTFVVACLADACLMRAFVFGTVSQAVAQVMLAWIVKGM